MLNPQVFSVTDKKLYNASLMKHSVKPQEPTETQETLKNLLLITSWKQLLFESFWNPQGRAEQLGSPS